MHMPEYWSVEENSNGRVYKPKRPKWKATELSFTTDYDTDFLREVYVNGIRFTRAPEYQESCEVIE